MSIWSSLDELAGKVASNAGKLVDSVVDSRIKAESNPPIVQAPNATAVSNPSRVPASDPNNTQKYVLWGLGGVVAIVAIALILRKI